MSAGIVKAYNDMRKNKYIAHKSGEKTHKDIPLKVNTGPALRWTGGLVLVTEGRR